jgi:hypothetical protein
VSHNYPVSAVTIGEHAGRPFVAAIAPPDTGGLFDFASGGFLHRLSERLVWHMAVVPGTSRPLVIVGQTDNEMGAYDATRSQWLWRLDNDREDAPPVAALAAHAQTVAIGDRDGSVTLRKVVDGSVTSASTKLHEGAVTALALSAGPHPLVISAGEDGRVLADGTQFAAHDAPVRALTTRLGGETPMIASGSEDGVVRVGAPGRGEPLSIEVGSAVLALALVDGGVLVGTQQGLLRVEIQA